MDKKTIKWSSSCSCINREVCQVCAPLNGVPEKASRSRIPRATGKIASIILIAMGVHSIVDGASWLYWDVESGWLPHLLMVTGCLEVFFGSYAYSIAAWLDEIRTDQRP